MMTLKDSVKAYSKQIKLKNNQIYDVKGNNLVNKNTIISFDQYDDLLNRKDYNVNYRIVDIM